MTQKYQVIARKYRPQTFREVVSQEAIVTTLKNALRFDKAAHAYLFCGSRGVGKTTLARLFAKALNCGQLREDLEPCNECPSCLEIASGQSLDVIEIDGASNRGIDDIRQINETVGYAPSHGKYKIYIIDEVHMLTKEAFNALLKTLEEPPERAKFFFATTESHKVLPTIISRCQRFDLSRIDPSLISSKLQEIVLDLNRSAEPAALHLIASFSEGSLRDAESLLDQILCFTEGPLTESAVRQSLGLIPQEHFFELDTAFSEYRLPYAFELVDLLFQTGRDLAHFLEQLVEHYRRLALCKMVGEKSLPIEIAARYQLSAKLYTQPQCLHILDILIQAEASFQKSSFQRIALETLLLQIIRSKQRVPLEVLVRRLSELEKGPLQQIPRQEEVAHTPLPPQKADEPAPPKQEEMKSEPMIHETAQEPPAPAPVLKPVPFNPYSPPTEPAAPPRQENKVLVEEQPAKHPSHYETLMRFAAVELEGTLKLH
jgi:DNA polymerase-3 subunit gamma/tau